MADEKTTDHGDSPLLRAYRNQWMLSLAWEWLREFQERMTPDQRLECQKLAERIATMRRGEIADRQEHPL